MTTQARYRARARQARAEMVESIVRTMERFERGEEPLDFLDRGDLEIVAATMVALSRAPSALAAVKDLAHAHGLLQSLADGGPPSGDSPSVTPTAVEGAGGPLGALAPPAPDADPRESDSDASADPFANMPDPDREIGAEEHARGWCDAASRAIDYGFRIIDGDVDPPSMIADFMEEASRTGRVETLRVACRQWGVDLG